MCQKARTYVCNGSKTKGLRFLQLAKTPLQKTVDNAVSVLQQSPMFDTSSESTRVQPAQQQHRAPRSSSAAPSFTFSPLQLHMLNDCTLECCAPSQLSSWHVAFRRRQHSSTRHVHRHHKCSSVAVLYVMMMPMNAHVDGLAMHVDAQTCPCRCPWAHYVQTTQVDFHLRRGEGRGVGWGPPVLARASSKCWKVAVRKSYFIVGRTW